MQRDRFDFQQPRIKHTVVAADLSSPWRFLARARLPFAQPVGAATHFAHGGARAAANSTRATILGETCGLARHYWMSFPADLGRQTLEQRRRLPSDRIKRRGQIPILLNPRSRGRSFPSRSPFSGSRPAPLQHCRRRIPPNTSHPLAQPLPHRSAEAHSL
jgi:hypothetical protein